MRREAERTALDQQQTENLHAVQLDWIRRQFEVPLRAALRITDALAGMDMDDVTRAILDREAATVRGFHGISERRDGSRGPVTTGQPTGRRRTLQDLKDGGESIPGQLDLLGGA